VEAANKVFKVGQRAIGTRNCSEKCNLVVEEEGDQDFCPDRYRERRRSKKSPVRSPGIRETTLPLYDEDRARWDRKPSVLRGGEKSTRCLWETDQS